MMKFGLSSLGEGWQSQSRSWQFSLPAASSKGCSLPVPITLNVPTKTPPPQPPLQRNQMLPFPPTLRDQQGNWRTLGSPREVSPAAIFTIQQNILVSPLSPSPYSSGDGEDVRTWIFPHCSRAGPAGGVGAKGVKVWFQFTKCLFSAHLQVRLNFPGLSSAYFIH